MNHEQVDDLLVEWEIARQQGRELRPEELTEAVPDLCDEVRARIDALKATSWMVDDTLDEEDWDAGVSVAATFDPKVSTLSGIATPLSGQQFLDAVFASGILTAKEIDWLGRLVSHYGAHLEPHELADRLVEEHLLTEYQATVLLTQKKLPMVLDRYIVLDTLGAGGMGLVYKAMHRSMQRVVALKILPPHAMDSPTKVARFRREIMAAAKLVHPNIVAAYDAHEADGIHFLVMEYVVGEDLKKTVLENGPLPIEDASRIVFLVASALDEAHRQEIVHRDVKPSNILLADDGTPKLLDLGLARVKATMAHESSNQLTRDGLAIGTAAYMSPEQAVNPVDADARSDIYSLGCTLYFLVGGKPPYDRQSSLETLRAHVDEPTPKLRDVNPEVSEDLERVFQKMIAKKPGERYATMRQVCEALIANGLVDAQTATGSGQYRALSERPPVAAPTSGGWRRPLGYAAAAVLLAALTYFAISSALAPDMTDRNVAAWALANGGVVRAETSLGVREFDNPDDMPDGDFRVVGLELRDPESPVSLAPLAELNELRSLTLDGFQRERLPTADISKLRMLRELNLVDDGLRDDDLTEIAKLERLDQLDVSENELTDAALTQIAPMTSLKRLILAGTAVDDLGLAQLSTFPELSMLSLDRCTVTDEGMAALVASSNLETLLLNGTEIGDAGLARLAELRQLNHLELADTNVTANGLEVLKEFAELRHLRLSGLPVSAELVGALSSLPQLVSLELAGNQVTDDRLQRLGALKQLRTLRLSGTAITPGGRQQLAAALPDCEIIVD